MIMKTEINNLKEVQDILDAVIKTCVNDRGCPDYVGNEIIKVKYALEYIKEERLKAVEYRDHADFLPKNGEKYLTAYTSSWHSGVMLKTWRNQPSDYSRYICGNVFKDDTFGRQSAQEYANYLVVVRETSKELERNEE